MFAKEWSKRKNVRNKKILSNIDLPEYKERIKLIAPLVWGEHCVECAAPECYRYCELYRPRVDGKCMLIQDGIIPRHEFKGILGYAIEVNFRKWGKLEAFCNIGQYSLVFIQLIDKILTLFASIFKSLASSLPQFFPKWGITNFYYKVREGIALILGKKSGLPDAFLIGMINNKKPFQLIIEIKTKHQSKYRTSVTVREGYSQYILPFCELNISNKERHQIYVYPENKEQSTSVIFTALDFVSFKGKSDVIESNILPITSDKIKCVAWDLDNTIWSGILIEDRADQICINPNIVDMIKSLDKRGILNCICSKNDFEVAFAKVKEFGIEEYFVGYQINWEPKSINLQRIAQDLNIGIDTFAFIDDSEFERNEVATALPMVRCFDVKEVVSILNRPEFDVPITNDSVNRRKTYQTLKMRNKEQKEWAGNIDEFLRSCDMVMTIGKPRENEVLRCFELLQRTNQLNISGRRLSLEQVREIVQDFNSETFVIICKDKFGDYGIVGFAIIDLSKGNPILTDLVISCRVANKKVEHTLFDSLAKRYKDQGYEKLYITYKSTKKNGPLSKVFTDLNMTIYKEQTEFIVYELEISKDLLEVPIMSIYERDDKDII